MSGDLDVPGAFNVRHVSGGLFRADALHRLDSVGWSMLVDAGVRTLIDLRTSAQAAEAPSNPPATIERKCARLEEGLDDHPLFRGWFDTGAIATPLYYEPFVAGWPERVVDALRLVATSEGPLVHCSKGSDRTGMIVALILELVGTSRDAIVADYRHTERRVQTHGPAVGFADDTSAIQAIMDHHGTTLEAALEAFLDGPSLQILHDHGLDDALVAELHKRVCG